LTRSYANAPRTCLVSGPGPSATVPSVARTLARWLFLPPPATHTPLHHLVRGLGQVGADPPRGRSSRCHRTRSAPVASGIPTQRPPSRTARNDSGEARSPAPSHGRSAHSSRFLSRFWSRVPISRHCTPTHGHDSPAAPHERLHPRAVTFHVRQRLGAPPPRSGKVAHWIRPSACRRRLKTDPVSPVENGPLPRP
jgi:hypothetical protein